MDQQTISSALNTPTRSLFPSQYISFADMSSAPRDGTVIVARIDNMESKGALRRELRIRWVKTPEYEGWDVGPMIQPREWRLLATTETHTI